MLEIDGTYALREPAEAYAANFTGKNEALRTQIPSSWDESVDDARTWLDPTRKTPYFLIS